MCSVEEVDVYVCVCVWFVSRGSVRVRRCALISDIHRKYQSLK